LGSHEEIGSWGHEYVRHLTGEISQEWQELDNEKRESSVTREQLEKLISKVVPYLMAHNAEAEACDILMEVEKIDTLEKFVDESAYNRVCLYLKR
jgi:26S proteasome regulatory subunit N1